MGVVLDMSERVGVLHCGRRIGNSTTDEERSNADVIRAYLGAGH
jgi:branched-chain amino acid transport system ATP-binding protein